MKSIYKKTKQIESSETGGKVPVFFYSRYFQTVKSFLIMCFLTECMNFFKSSQKERGL
ncbi:hypothetical protein HMPREF1379_02934 [Enterococcus faecium R497]|nr:hypothetical protein HMPREF1379_02934 [Enterococcus faecium R497]